MHPCLQKILVGGLLSACLFCSKMAGAQARAGTTLPNSPVLSQLVRNSGYIFSGTVSAFAHVAPSNSNEVATVKITFQVEQAIRGVRTGQSLVIHEWAGLWQSGPRYRLGERVVLFLYPPSRLGLTSPVAGAMGRFNVDGNGQVLLQQAQLDALRPFSGTSILRAGGIAISTKDFARAVQLARGK